MSDGDFNGLSSWRATRNHREPGTIPQTAHPLCVPVLAKRQVPGSDIKTVLPEPPAPPYNTLEPMAAPNCGVEPCLQGLSARVGRAALAYWLLVARDVLDGDRHADRSSTPQVMSLVSTTSPPLQTSNSGPR